MKCNFVNIPKRVVLKQNFLYKASVGSSCPIVEPKLSIDNLKNYYNPQILNDLDYKKQLLKNINIPGITILALSSILGPVAFKSFIEENNNNPDIYRPGIRPEGKEDINDSYPLTNVMNRTFGANLHIHTTDSDGELSVETLLEQAAEYANLYAIKNNKPFVIAITDHNTVSSCKKALEILAKNPDKYRNLRVVLGAEISAKEESIYDYQLKKPEKFHILTLCIDPYEFKFNDFLNYMNEGRKNPMNPKAVTVQEVVDAIKEQKQAYLSYAHPAFPDLKHRITSPDDDYCKLNQDCIKFFVEKAGKKALYAETYYGGYCGTMATDNNLHKAINEAVEKYGLSKAGGLDTHGDSIFYNGQKIKPKKKKNKQS